MGRLWTEDIQRQWEDYREETTAWELMHEEEGFEDLGFMMDSELSDLEGQQTHMHFAHARPRRERTH